MKYIIGYTSFEYAINGIRIPKRATSRADQPGEKGVTEVTAEQLSKLRENRVFKNLEDRKDIKVLDTKPSWAVTSMEKINTQAVALKEKVSENETLRKEVEELKKQLAAKAEEPKK